MEAYSIDMRVRVMVAVEGGIHSREEIAESFGITSRRIRKLVKQYRDTSSVEPLTQAGGREEKSTPQRLQRLKTHVDKKPTATLDELRLVSRVRCFNMTVSRALNQLGYTRKKDATCQRARSPRSEERA